MGYYIVDYRNPFLAVLDVSNKKVEWGSLAFATHATTFAQANKIANMVQELGYRVKVVPSGG